MRTDVLGIVFSNTGDGLLRELTQLRCLGSVPFGGRYRMIDFSLSNMVNAGVSKVAITTRHNYRSLMDHLGSGKPWDLSRKKGGIYLSPPFIGAGSRDYANRIDELDSLKSFLKNSDEEYVVMCDCDCVVNLDVEKMVSRHIESNADITVAYTNGALPVSNGYRMVFSFDDDQRITEILLSPENAGICDYSINTFILKKSLLVEIIKDAVSRNYTGIERDVLQRSVDSLKIYGFKAEGYVRVLDSLNTYLWANLELCKSDVRNQLFNSQRAIFTKIKDEMPTKYGLGSSVKNVLAADGCVIDGEVENCVLFRGVKIKKGASVRNCIIMQNTVIGENSNLSYAVCDKNVVISAEKSMIGAANYPIFIGKDSII